MGLFIIKQPDGKLALWSTIVDAFTWTDCTREEVIDILHAAKRAEIVEAVDRSMAHPQMTWEECQENLRALAEDEEEDKSPEA